MATASASALMPPVDVAGRQANGEVILGEAESIDPMRAQGDPG
jgi:hypothetical protein